MKKLFSIASWNVEHFKKDAARIERIINFLKLQAADVFALYEVESSVVYDSIVSNFPDYNFHITEGAQTQEILVGARNSLTSFFTQKTEFKSGNTYLRPGALLTIRIEDEDYPILFLHTKSSTEPIGLGIRDDMFSRAFSFKKFLDGISVKAGKGNSNFIFLGDLNIMGMDYPYNKEITFKQELKKLTDDAAKIKMRVLTKNSNFTWWNGPSSRMKPMSLDQVVVSEQIQFSLFKKKEVDVRGWVNENTDAAKGAWIMNYSDHSLLYFEIVK